MAEPALDDLQVLVSAIQALTLDYVRSSQRMTQLQAFDCIGGMCSTARQLIDNLKNG